MHQEVYGSSKEMKFLLIMTIDNSKSFKCKAAPVEKSANHNNGNSSVKDTNNSCTIKVFE